KTDALATAIFVLGAEKGMALARREGVEALLIDANGKRHSTEGFDKYRTTR
ncbi:MAG: FAD:protein FMN transferase, partial [Gammaproteobacteria bacterium]|nr:FAD:protein FMN transferase [Gammaproteobacteria bacterium]